MSTIAGSDCSVEAKIARLWTHPRSAWNAEQGRDGLRKRCIAGFGRRSERICYRPANAANLNGQPSMPENFQEKAPAKEDKADSFEYLPSRALVESSGRRGGCLRKVLLTVACADDLPGEHHEENGPSSYRAHPRTRSSAPRHLRADRPRIRREPHLGETVLRRSWAFKVLAQGAQVRCSRY
jgi:hypothetical protein